MIQSTTPECTTPDPATPERTTPNHYLPTPEEIAEECRRIRAGWSLREHYARAGLIQNWTVPEHRASPEARIITR